MLQDQLASLAFPGPLLGAAMATFLGFSCHWGRGPGGPESPPQQESPGQKLEAGSCV